jgi:iron complex outermembrane receptor protein
MDAMNWKQLGIATGVGLLAAWVLVVPTMAQTTTDQTPTAAPSGSQGLELQEIQVSARRVGNENLQTVPITITALSADDIRQKGIVDPSDFNDTIPGLSVAPAYLSRASSSYTLRGQGQVLGGGDPAVATYFDDVPTVVAGPGYMFDLTNIEVLKGPQGTLFGKNSTGGAVLFVPQRPTDTFGGYADVTMGDYNQRRYQAALNVPLMGDQLLVRLALDNNHRDGYVTNPANGQQYDNTNYTAYRLSAIYRPNDRFENFLLVNYADLSEGGPGIECVGLNPAGAFIPQATADCQAQFAAGPRTVNLYVPPAGNYIVTRERAADDTMTFKVSDDITLKNIFGYREHLVKQSYESYGLSVPLYEIVGNPYWSWGFGQPSPSEITYSDEIQLHGDSLNKRLHWTTGLFFDTVSPYSDDDQDTAIGLFIGNGSILQNTRSLMHSKDKAIYGQVTYDITDKLNFTVGARYTEDRKDVDGSQWTSQTCIYRVTPPTQFGPGAYCNIAGSADFSSPTWDLSLQYQLSPDTMVYLTSRRGYISGGWNAVAPTPQEFAPEHTIDGEFGEKTEFHFGDVQGRVNTSLFYSYFTNWQERIGVVEPVTVNGVTTEQNFAYFANAADGVIEGLEFDGTIIPTRNIELSANYAYTRAYYTQNMFQGVNYIDSPVPEVAKHKGSITARYILGLPSGVGEASISATEAAQAKLENALTALRTGQTSYGPAGTALPAYAVLNLHADWKGVMGIAPLELDAYVNNALNRTYLTLFINNWALGFNNGDYAPPRQFGVEARWTF